MSDAYYVVNENQERSPEIPEICYDVLPEQIRQLLGYVHYRYERELFLLSTLCSLGSLCNQTRTLYNERTHAPYLFFCATGVFGTGKSAMMLPHAFLSQYDMQLRKDYEKRANEHSKDMRRRENRKESEDENYEEPQPPKEDLLLLEADTTAAGLFERLNNAQQCAALYINDEAGTLIKSVGGKFGDFSDFLCKAYDHTTYSFRRKFGGENNSTRSYHLNNIRLAISIAGTPETLKPFFESNFNNGLFSRFIHYRLPCVDEFAEPKQGRDMDYFIRNEVSTEIMSIAEYLRQEREFPTLVTIPEVQLKRITSPFKSYKPEKMAQYGSAFGGMAHRLATTAVRIAVIIATLREYRERTFDSPPNTITATEHDVTIAIELINVIKWYTEDAYANYIMQSKHVETDAAPLALGQMLAQVDDTFTRAEWQAAAECIVPALSKRTADRMLSNEKYIKRVGNGVYEKV